MDWVKTGLGKLGTMTGVVPGETDLEIAHRQEELQKDFLRNVRYNDVDFFHLNGYECWARCIKQWDGDTITCAMFLNGKPFKFRVRLADIDTAEKTSEDEAEVVHAMKASNRLKELINDDLIYIKCHRWDKYGRLLAHLYAKPEDTFSFNEILRVEGLAYTYKGGKRKPFREWVSCKYLDNIPAPTTEPVLPDDNINDAEALAVNPETTIVSDADYKPQSNAQEVISEDVAIF